MMDEVEAEDYLNALFRIKSKILFEDAGGEYWAYEIEREGFGKLQCKYYPAAAFTALGKFFEEHFSQPAPESQLAYAKEILAPHMKAILSDVLRQAVHEVTTRTLWELKGITHRLELERPTGREELDRAFTHEELINKALGPAIKAAKERMRFTPGRPPLLTDAEKVRLYDGYKELLEICRRIKKEYAAELKRFEKVHHGRGFSFEKWAVAWLTYAKEVYPDYSPNFLTLFASENNSLRAFEIAQSWIAQKMGCSPEYLSKLLTDARRKAK